ncbi:CoA pyrophosphatase, partial [Xanthomonas citri pv. citri]|nr:CoA pyrophosphatase [Xanthomonas citri pv. citri]
GFTAALLDRVLALLGWDVPWDDSRVRDARTHRILRG